MIKRLKLTTDAESPWAFKVEQNLGRELGDYTDIKDIKVTQRSENLGEVCVIYLDINPNDDPRHMCKNAVELFASVVYRFNHMTPYQAANANNWHIDFDPELEPFMKWNGDNMYNRQTANPLNLFIVFPYNDQRKSPPDWIPCPWEGFIFKSLPAPPSPNTPADTTPENRPQDLTTTCDVVEIGIYYKTTTGKVIYKPIGG